MTEWNPREEMGPFWYLLFKMRLWVRVDTVPEWVDEASRVYFRGYQDKYGHRPYDEQKVFTGNSLRYKIEFDNYKR